MALGTPLRKTLSVVLRNKAIGWRKAKITRLKVARPSPLFSLHQRKNKCPDWKPTNQKIKTTKQENKKQQNKKTKQETPTNRIFKIQLALFKLGGEPQRHPSTRIISYHFLFLQEELLKCLPSAQYQAAYTLLGAE
jgi:hypothetical protein